MDRLREFGTHLVTVYEGVPSMFMMRGMIAWTCCLFCFQACNISDSRRLSSQEGSPVATKKEINDQEAIGIAKDHARTAGQYLDGYQIVICKQPRMWRIIFDGGGPEYLISKKDGKVLASYYIPQENSDKNNPNLSEPLRPISKEAAIAATKSDAEHAYGSVVKYDVIGCELANSWRVIYDLREDTVGGGPEYVVDKWSGKIIHKRYYQ